MKTNRLLSIWLLILLMPLLCHAYIDPGSGSYFFQMAIAGLLGAIFSIKVFWKRLKNGLSNKKKPEEHKEKPE